MKIIKKGIDPKNRVYRFYCSNCKTEFECEQREAKFNSDQRDGNYLSINCPVCNQNCSIDADQYVGNPLER